MRIISKLYQFPLVVLSMIILFWQPVSAQDETATYSVTFDALWSANSPHPHSEGTGTFPGSAHFSPLIGGVHSDSITFWESGGSATLGIKNMAELGLTGELDTEVQTAIAESTALSVINGPDVFPSPGIATIPAITVTTSYPLVTLVTMIAPSPDWFLGVSSLSLIVEGEWVEEIIVDLHAYDAGTEEGTGFSISNDATTPQGEISPLSDHVLGIFTFTRIDEDRNMDNTDEGHKIFLPIVR